MASQNSSNDPCDKFKLIKQKINGFDKSFDMFVFDYDCYTKNQIGYDIISKDISRFNCWEPFQTEITKEILKTGKDIFIDIGHHLGYYSLLAAAYGNTVYSIDCNKNYIDIFKKSILLNHFNTIHMFNIYIDKKFTLNQILDKNKQIKLIKCDIEGYEIEFIDSITEQLKNKTIQYMIIEISPNFRKNYPEYVLKIKNFGYKIYDIGLSPPRRLNSENNLENMLKPCLLDINNLDDMTKYINSFKEHQSNFLFQRI